MSYTYADLITQFRQKMRDPAALNNKYFQDAEILAYLIDGLNEAVRRVGLSVFTRTLTINASAAEYNAPCDSMKILDVRDSDGTKIYQTTRENLESINERWPEDTGSVYCYLLERGVSGFRMLFYKKPTASETLTIKAWRLPSHGDDVAETDVPELDTAVIKLTLDYALAQGFLKKDERTLYDYHINRFEKVNIPEIKKYIRRFADGIPRLESNETGSKIGMGRLPDNYPETCR